MKPFIYLSIYLSIYPQICEKSITQNPLKTDTGNFLHQVYNYGKLKIGDHDN